MLQLVSTIVCFGVSAYAQKGVRFCDFFLQRIYTCTYIGPIDTQCYNVYQYHFPGFENLKKFYYIYEVFYVSAVRMKVILNDKIDVLAIDEKIPIGFRLKRYDIQPDGLIGPLKHVDDKKWRVNWVKCSQFRNPMEDLPSPPGMNGNYITCNLPFLFIFIQSIRVGIVK